MSITKFFGAFAPEPKVVSIDIFRHITRDPRAPLTFAEQFEANKRAFKARRARECRKVEPASELGKLLTLSLVKAKAKRASNGR